MPIEVLLIQKFALILFLYLSQKYPLSTNFLYLELLKKFAITLFGCLFTKKNAKLYKCAPKSLQIFGTYPSFNLHVFGFTLDDVTFEKIERILTSEGLVFDWAETSSEGIGFLTLAKYRLIIYDQSKRSWKITGLIRYLNRYLDHIRIVALVRDQISGENALKCGVFQYLIGPHFRDGGKLVACLRSAQRYCADGCGNLFAISWSQARLRLGWI